MMVFKGCPRCNGDVYIENDVGFSDLVCLQCGSRRPVAAASEGSQEEANLLRWLQAHPTTIAA